MFYVIKHLDIDTGEIDCKISEKVPIHYISKIETPSGSLGILYNQAYYSIPFQSKKQFRDFLKDNNLSYDSNQKIWHNRKEVPWKEFFVEDWDYYFQNSHSETLSQFFIHLNEISKEGVYTDYSDDVVSWWYKKEMKVDSQTVQ